MFILFLFVLRTTFYVSSNCQLGFSSEFEVLLSSHRHTGKWLKANRIASKRVKSELQCLDLCLREPRCASLNYKRVWIDRKKAWKYMCQINRESSRTSQHELRDNLNSTHFDVNSGQISEVILPRHNFLNYNHLMLVNTFLENPALNYIFSLHTCIPLKTYRSHFETLNHLRPAEPIIVLNLILKFRQMLASELHL